MYRTRRRSDTQGTPRLRGRKAVKQRERRLKRTNYLCEWCVDAGRVRIAVVVDHIVPLIYDGPDTDENTRNLCHDCHLKATAEQFGTTYTKRVEVGLDGWPIEDGGLSSKSRRQGAETVAGSRTELVRES